MDLEFFMDTTAWVIGLVIWIVFMIMIWKFGSMFGGEWPMPQKIAITVIGLPLCYAMAKLRIDR